MALGMFYFSVFMFTGILAAQVFCGEESGMVRVTLGLSFGLVLNAWLPALWAFGLGFGFAAQAAGLGCCMALALGLGFVLQGQKKAAPPSVYEPVHLLLLPLLIFTLIILYTHTILPKADGLYSGQSTFGDMAMHLGFITSISVQKTFPPNYNILAGAAPLGYPFLCDSISSTYYTLTGRLRFSYILPMVPALAAVMYGGYILLEEWLKDKSKAIFGTLLFFVGGGFGFVYFFDRLAAEPYKIYNLLNGFYQTPTNLTEKNIIWVNVIADLLIPQRATLLGWAVLFPALYLLCRAAFGGQKKYFALLGILGGSLPLIHTHSFLALAVISGAVLLLTARPTAKDLTPWGIYAVTALCLSAPQIFGFTLQQASGDGFLRFHFNWANKADNYFWFYAKNMGIVYLLIVPGLLHIDGQRRKLYLGGILLAVLCEFIVFQPNEYDNNKLLYVWHLLNCGLAANFLLEAYKALREIRGAWAAAIILVVVMNISGVLTLAREIKSEYLVFEERLLPSAEFIKANTPADAVFLTADNHNNVVAALTGRNIFCGSGSYLYFHGVDYAAHYAAQAELFHKPEIETLRLWGIDYVYVGEYERGGFEVNEALLGENLILVYSDGAADIYQVP